jgi:hypothetical protein
VVAIVRDPQRFVPCDPLAWNAVTLAEHAELCEGEPFADQPVIAGCSGTLIDRNLVVTAQHCIGTDDACRSARFLTGLYNDESGALRELRPSDVYSCRARVAVPEGRDIVVIELDRPVAAPYGPMPVAEVRPHVGESLRVAGFPTGIPMKIASGCSVLDYYEAGDDYRINCDLFAGNSGSGVFDSSAELLGVYFSGAGDYRPRAPGECFVRQTLAEDGTGVGVVPQLGSFEPIESAIDSLCATGYPSALCGGAAACGDGVCSSDETFASCAADCDDRRCGNGVCELDEHFSCAADCGERAVTCASDAGVPAVPDAGVSRADAGADSPAGASGGGCSTAGESNLSFVMVLLLLSRRSSRGTRECSRRAQ